MIGVIATSLQFVYGFFLCVIGLYGMFCLNWELHSLYALFPAQLDGPQGNSFLNQFRFLKSIELAFGLFCLLYRKDILAGGQATTLFLAALALGAFARSYSWAIDGRPEGLFLFFLGVEVVTFVFVLVHSRRAWSER